MEDFLPELEGKVKHSDNYILVKCKLKVAKQDMFVAFLLQLPQNKALSLQPKPITRNDEKIIFILITLNCLMASCRQDVVKDSLKGDTVAVDKDAVGQDGVQDV